MIAYSENPSKLGGGSRGDRTCVPYSARRSIVLCVHPFTGCQTRQNALWAHVSGPVLLPSPSKSLDGTHRG